MKKIKLKKSILLYFLAGAALIGTAAILLLLLLPQKPDPRTLLEEAESRSAQNLCLLSMLEQDPEDRAAAERLLENYRAQGADPLTIYALAQKYGLEAGRSRGDAPEAAGKILQKAGIAARKNYKDAYAVAQGTDTTYYATNEGIYADYKGLEIKISGIRAEGLTAAEGGVYFINVDQRKVQYLARDGHRIQTLSMVDAQSFAFFKEKLWIASTEGTLYCEGVAVETPFPVRMLAATEDQLFAAVNGENGRAAGVLALDGAGGCEAVLTSPAFTLWGGADGCLYYLNEYGYPMRYDPSTKEASMLIQKKAAAVTYEEGTVYYLTEKGKIKKIA